MKIEVVSSFSFVVKDNEGNEKPLMEVEFEPLDAVLVDTNKEDIIMINSDYKYNNIETFCNCIGYDVMPVRPLDIYKHGLSLIGFYKHLPIELYIRINGKSLQEIDGVEFKYE